MAKIESGTNLKVKTFTGRQGSFEVKLGEKVLFSRLAAGGYPEAGTLIASIAKEQKGGTTKEGTK